MNEHDSPKSAESADSLGQAEAPRVLNRQARIAMARRLSVGTEKGTASVWLDAVELAGNELWLRFESGGGERVDVRVAEVGGDLWYGTGKTLKFGFKGRSLTRLAEALLGRSRTALDGTPFSKLKKFAEENSVSLSLRSQEPAPTEGAEAGGQEASHAVECGPGYLPDGPTTRDWAHPDQWREFSAYAALQANPWESFLGHLAMGSAQTEVRHGDIECQDLNGVAAANPWLFSKQGEFVTEQGSGGRVFLTHIDDRDVVYGTAARRLEGVLDQLHPGPQLPVLQFYNCCIPMMTGDDVRGALGKFSQRTGVSYVYTDMSPLTCSEETTSAQFERRIQALSAVPLQATEGRYNLVGFRPGQGRSELVALLAQAGAELNATLLPELPVGPAEAFGCAACQAFLPNAYYERFYRMLEGSAVPRIAGSAPFGREGSVGWLKALVQLLGRQVEERMAHVLDAQLASFDAQWDAGREKAEKHGIALVVGPGDVARLGKAALTGGVVVPRVLSEMGFSVYFLVYRATDASPAAEPLTSAEAKLRALIVAGGRSDVLPFATREELGALLRSGRFSAVYSNLRRDTRLTRAGLMGIALSDFDMGLGGALRTQRRILSLCEVPFFRRYARHLGDA